MMETEAQTSIFDLIGELSQNERLVLKESLSQRIDGFFDKNNHIHFDTDEAVIEFHHLARTLRMLTQFNEGIPENGIGYYGRPSWVTPSLIGQLQAEATTRRDQPLDRIDHFLGCGGKVADALSTDTRIVEFVSKHVGKVRPTGIASYLFYDQAGSGIRPHVDTEVFSVNLMMMLKHIPAPGIPPSATSVFPPYKAPEHYWLQVGEVMLMHGSSTIHTRTIVAEDEQIHLLTIGFNRIE